MSRSGFYEYRRRPLSPTALRSIWLTGLITEIHARSRGTYGARRVRAELALGMGVSVSLPTVGKLMSIAGIQGIPKRKGIKNIKQHITTADLVNRQFTRTQPNQLWVTDLPSTRRKRASSIAAPSWMPSVERSSAGPSIIIKTQTLSLTPWTWRSRTALHLRAMLSTPTTVFNSHPGYLLARLKKRGCCHPLAPLVMLTITRLTRIVLVKNANRTLQPPALEYSRRTSQ